MVESLGGKVGLRLGLVNGFSAEVPADDLAALENARGVHSVSPNGKVELLGHDYDAGHDLGSLFNLARATEAREMWKKGFTGKGIDVALIDTGVVPVNGLRSPGKIINGPDLSFESQVDNLRHLDTFGHGTHMAGIVAGRDDEVVSGAEDKKEYVAGVAPDARIVNVKVADSEGATDVSQVIAAIDWVVQHRSDNGMNIRVLNLSFGTDGIQDYRLDPLSYAAEVAWHKGIVVVAAAGNSGYGNSKLNNPAYNPWIIAVGAVKANGTPDTKDDTIPEWSSRGDGVRNPDVVAPGRSVASFRAPGSNADIKNPQAVVDGRLFLGSGTSQAAAAVSGAAALILQQRPNATPDQVKRLLMTSATRLPSADPVAQGAGLINLKNLIEKPTPSYVQKWARGAGTGSLDLARGSGRLADAGVPLVGERDIFGNVWDGSTWALSSWNGTSWSGGLWNGRRWTGDNWSGLTWTGLSWGAATWKGDAWSGRRWTEFEWSGRRWTASGWTGHGWTGDTWTGRSWRSDVWSSAGYGEG